MEWTAAIVILGAAAAGFLQGISGSGFAISALAAWVWQVEPALAAPLAVFGSLVVQLVSVTSLRAAFNLARALPFVIGSLAGIPIGVALLKNVDATVFRIIVGLTIAGFAIAMLASARFPKVAFGGRLADGGIGFVGGLSGGFAGLPEPAPALWGALRGWKKDAQRAALQTFAFTANAIALALFAGAGFVTGEAMLLALLLLPATVLPMLVGRRLYKKAREPIYRRLVLVVLALSGSGLVAITVVRALS